MILFVVIYLVSVILSIIGMILNYLRDEYVDLLVGDVIVGTFISLCPILNTVAALLSLEDLLKNKWLKFWNKAFILLERIYNIKIYERKKKVS